VSISPISGSAPALNLYAVILQLHIHNTVLTLHEHSLNTNRSKTFSADPSNSVQRLESLWTCLTTTKALFSIFLSLESFPIATYPLMSMSLYGQLAHCLVALFRLTTFEHPEVSWDRQKVKQELDLREVLRIWIERWEKVPEAAGLQINTTGGAEETFWSLIREKFLAIASWYDLKLAAMSTAEAEKQNIQVPASNGSLNGSMASIQPQSDIDFTTVNVDQFDDTWMRDLLGAGFEFTEPYF
jgi:hypothetical protein